MKLLRTYKLSGGQSTITLPPGANGYVVVTEGAVNTDSFERDLQLLLESYEGAPTTQPAPVAKAKKGEEIE